jgi:hypothetical protein
MTEKEKGGRITCHHVLTHAMNWGTDRNFIYFIFIYLAAVGCKLRA